MEPMICKKDMGCRREVTVGRYLDPFDGFREKEAAFEIRRDEITGVTSRILPYRLKVPQKPDVQTYIDRSPEALCPFCPGLFEKITPRFTPDLVAEGKFKHGMALLFPNAFPYDRYNTVVRFSPQHYVPLPELTPELTLDGFLVCRDYFRRMVELHPELRYCSINWNYMPPAGGGLLHPHIQTVIGETPTRFMQGLCDSAGRYRESEGGNLWEDFIAYEKEQGERFIADTGAVTWLAAFAPKGMAGEVSFFFRERRSIFALTEGDFIELLTGLSRIFAYLEKSNFISFNLALYATIQEDDILRVQGKLVPRFVILPLGTSDLNDFEKLHDEIICPVMPEDHCRDLKPWFQD